MNMISADELLNHAFRLAYFLHCDRKTATEITLRSLNKLELAASAQGKRLYYRLSGRADSRKTRSKVSMGEPHLLQRLVYVESEEYERLREAAARDSAKHPGATPARQADLVVFFIKHLVRITVRRNSFYVTLGLSRLLYNYTTPETMELYNLVIQDPDRVHDDYYYRSRKGLLLKELKERFGELVEVTKGARGEQRWEPSREGRDHRELVDECLRWFTPWSTSCVVPEKLNPINDTIEKLNFGGRHPDEEHEVEVNRIHATLHPDCFARLAAANRLAKPDERLELPRFFLADDTNDTDETPRTPPHLSEDEARTINSLLAQEAMRRKAAATGLLRVMVDGRQFAEIDTKHSTSAKFSVDEDAEIIDVFGADQKGPLLLATHVLNLNGQAKQNAVITIEGGQRISFSINPHTSDNAIATGADVAITFAETAAGRTALLSLGRLADSLTNTARNWTSAGWWKPAVAFSALVLLLGGAWWAWTNRQKQPAVVRINPAPTPHVSIAIPNPEPSRAKDSPNTNDQQSTQKPNEAAPTPLIVKRDTAPRQRDEGFVERSLLPAGVDDIDATEATRGTWNIESMGKLLKDVSKVYLQSLNENDASNELLTELRARLESGGAVNLTDAQRADAALKLSVKPHVAGDGRIVATVRGVNARGYVVWPAQPRIGSWRYVGRPRYVAERIAADLTRDIQTARAR